MSDLVLVASIQGLVAVIVIVLGAKLNGKVNEVRGKINVVREQVQNGHSINLRDEQDLRHDENRERFEGTAAGIGQVLRELTEIRHQINRLWGWSARHTEQLDELDERTQPIRKTRFEPRPGKHTERAPHE